jgi:hypothetical protein
VQPRRRSDRGHWLLARLLITIAQQQPPGPEHAWSWSRWRRRRQYRAQACHYRRRGYAIA